MTQFRKKPVVITAITFDQLVAHGTEQCKAEGRQSNIVNGMPWSFSYAGHPITHENDDCYLIPTPEGTMKMGREDMLITGVKGEIYPCKRDIFEATYDEVPDAASNESSHDWRQSSSYGGQLCADCGAVKGSRRGGLECRDPHAGVATVALPVLDPGPDSLEREIQAKGLTAPRVTPTHVDAEISAEYSFTLDKALSGCPLVEGMDRVTVAVLVLKNGTKLVGVNYGAIDPAQHSPERGRQEARAQAVDKVYELLGFRLRDELASQVNQILDIEERRQLTQ